MEDLYQNGWSDTTVASLDGLTLNEMKQTVGSVGSSWGLSEFDEVRREAKRQRRIIDSEDRRFAREPVSFRKERNWKDREGYVDLSENSGGIQLQQRRSFLPKAIWPNRFSRRSAGEKDMEQRAKLEELERDRLANDLVSLLRKAGLLVKKDEPGAGLRESQHWLLKRHAMGRRPATLRQHVRLGRKLVGYAKHSYGAAWFKEPADVMEYVALRMEEPCGKSVPGSIWATLRFLQESAEVPAEKRISGDLALRNFFAEVSRHPTWPEGQPRSSAKRLTTSVAVAWENVVVASGERNYVRIFAWFKLIKLWAALRWDDTLGIPPSMIDMRPEVGLKGKIVRSKTTGEGRRVDLQEFYVSKDCWLRHPEWLADGWELFNEMGKASGNLGRDFLLPRPDKHLQGFRGSMVRYAEAMSMARALLNLAVVASTSNGMMGHLLITTPCTSGFWSDYHLLGSCRWCGARNSEEVGTLEAIYGRGVCQDVPHYGFRRAEGLAEHLRTNMDNKNVVEDDEILVELGAWLTQRGIAEEEVQLQVKRLMMRKGPRWRKIDGLGLGPRSPTTPGSPLLSPTEPAPDPAVVQDEELADLMIEDTGALPVVPGAFVLSVVGHSKRRTLHQVGSCYRIPGVRYKEFMVVGDSRPSLEQGEKLCATCFGKQQKIFEEASSAAESAEVELSSDSSSTSLGDTGSDD